MTMLSALSNTIPEGPSRYVIQYMASFSAYLLIMNSGMLQGWPSPSLPRLLYTNNTNCLICLTSSEGSWMASINMIGALVGALVAGVMGHRLGRKIILIISGLPFLVSWIVIALAETSTHLFIARFIGGLSDGLAYTVVPMYIGEISSPSIRGFLGTGISTSWIFGILLINIIGSYTNIHTAAIISCVIPFVAICSILIMPESPYYLLSKGKVDKARRSLEMFRGTSDVECDLNRIHDAVTSDAKNQGHYLELFTRKSNRRGVWVVCILRTIQQLSGTTAIIFYAQNIFAQSDNSIISYKEASIIYFAVQLIVVMISSGLIDKTGRRPLLFLSIAGSAIALFIEGTFFLIKHRTDLDTDSFSNIPLVAMVLYVIFFSLGLQGMPILMMGEIFPADVKPFALGLADIYYSVLATLMSKFFQITNDYFGLYFPFYSFALCCVCGLVLTVVFTPETKGKTLEEIQELLRGEPKHSKLQKKPEGSLNDITIHF